MTPQELMDMPYAGMAEKKLRQTRKWVLTKEERLSHALDGLMSAVDDASTYAYDVDRILNTEENT